MFVFRLQSAILLNKTPSLYIYREELRSRGISWFCSLGTGFTHKITYFHPKTCYTMLFRGEKGGKVVGNELEIEKTESFRPVFSKNSIALATFVSD